MRQHSPLTHTHKVKTPTLIQHAEGLRWSNSGLFGRADGNNQSSAAHTKRVRSERFSDTSAPIGDFEAQINQPLVALQGDGNQQISIPSSADFTDGFTAECRVWLERPADATERYHVPEKFARLATAVDN